MRSARRGFTLMEMIVVVVIVGILSAIAVMNLRQSRGKAMVASMHSDLRNVAVAQEGFYYQNNAYAAALPQLPVGVSPGVTIAITTADDKGWAATATAPSGTATLCAIFYGEPTARPEPSIAEGVIACH